MAPGSREALKLFAFVLMVFDHFNKYLYNESITGVFHAGRMVMPLFGFVLAYNLATSDALKRGVHRRVAIRLLLAGLAATPIVYALNSQLGVSAPWYPLNILFSLLLVVLSTYLIDYGGPKRLAAAVALILVGGAFVEYVWIGVLCCLAAWSFCRRATLARLIIWVWCTALLAIINRLDFWALVAVPTVLVVSHLRSDLPRTKWAFYTLYPVHLAVLLLIVRMSS